MKKINVRVLISVIVVVCIAIFALFTFLPRGIETGAWVLVYAQKTEPPMFVVAHGGSFDVSNSDDPMFEFSEPIDLVCKANGGKLVLTDKTNGNTYEGTYKITSIGGLRFGSEGASYDVVIEGTEGNANINSVTERMLSVYIGGYCLCFELD